MQKNNEVMRFGAPGQEKSRLHDKNIMLRQVIPPESVVYQDLLKKVMDDAEVETGPTVCAIAENDVETGITVCATADDTVVGDDTGPVSGVLQHSEAVYDVDCKDGNCSAMAL